jgi:hypothetical protein
MPFVAMLFARDAKAKNDNCHPQGGSIACPRPISWHWWTAPMEKCRPRAA